MVDLRRRQDDSSEGPSVSFLCDCFQWLQWK